MLTNNHLATWETLTLFLRQVLARKDLGSMAAKRERQESQTVVRESDRRIVLMKPM